MPLEPIDESDLDLKDKFLEKAPGSQDSKVSGVNNVAEIPTVVEKVIERKEGAAEKEGAYTKILSKVVAQSVPAKDGEVEGDAHVASQEMDVAGRVSRLVDLAMQKGVPHAVKVAMHLDNNYMLDNFHDKLVADELHDALLKNGLIKEL